MQHIILVCCLHILTSQNLISSWPGKWLNTKYIIKSNKISCNQYVSRATLCHFILQTILLMLTNQTEYIYTWLLWSVAWVCKWTVLVHLSKNKIVLCTCITELWVSIKVNCLFYPLYSIWHSMEWQCDSKEQRLCYLKRVHILVNLHNIKF